MELAGVLDQAALMALLRGLHLACTLSLMGVLGFWAWVLPAAGRAAVTMSDRLIRLWRISGIMALLTGAAWFVMEAASIAGTDSVRDLVTVLPVVGAHTRYGQTMLLRGGVLLAATLLAGGSRLRLYLALALNVVALALQGLIGHAGAMEGNIRDGIVASETLHLIAAGLWLGALLPLGVSLGRLPPLAAAAVCERFSPIGLSCVLVLAGTGLAQGTELVGSIAGLFGTHYGHLALLKITLFIIALGLAALNRLWLTDRLRTNSHQADTMAAPRWLDVMAPRDARTRLRISIVVETLIGLAIVLAAGFMASSQPAVHEQPVWPFPWRFSLVSVTEDAEFRREVVVSVALIGLAIIAMLAAFVWRRYRILGLLVMAGTLVVRAPSFALLTVEAYPTSFQTSPSGFSADSILHGQALFAENCVSCHGASGQGDGLEAVGLRIKPADLTMPHLWEHSDGELFWWMTHGIDDPEGGLAMPGFSRLPASDRWALIDYIRAHNAGLALRRDEALGLPVPAPTLTVQCSGINAARMVDLRGDVVLVRADAAVPNPVPTSAQLGLPVIVLDLLPNNSEGSQPPLGTCIAATPTAWKAYAIMMNVTPDKLAGAEFLIDPQGWLRAVQTPDMPNRWQTRDMLTAAVLNICANPLHIGGSEHEHHH